MELSSLTAYIPPKLPNFTPNVKTWFPKETQAIQLAFDEHVNILKENHEKEESYRQSHTRKVIDFTHDNRCSIIATASGGVMVGLGCVFGGLYLLAQTVSTGCGSTLLACGSTESVGSLVVCNMTLNNYNPLDAYQEQNTQLKAGLNRIKQCASVLESIGNLYSLWETLKTSLSKGDPLPKEIVPNLFTALKELQWIETTISPSITEKEVELLLLMDDICTELENNKFESHKIVTGWKKIYDASNEVWKFNIMKPLNFEDITLERDYYKKFVAKRIHQPKADKPQSLVETKVAKFKSDLYKELKQVYNS